MLLLYRNKNRIKKSEMNIGLKSMISELYWFSICLCYICILQWLYLWINLCSKKELWVFLTHWGWYVWLVLSNVVISVLFDYMLFDVWHLICVTCFGWDYECDVVCMIILSCYISLNKKTGGLSTKASVNWVDKRMYWGLCTKASRGWLDRWINQKFRY